MAFFGKFISKSSLGSAFRNGLNRLSNRFISNEKTEGELKIITQLKHKFPAATQVDVLDISDFEGKRTIMQHRMVNEALKDEIKDMHGLRISTSHPGAKS